jgi:hypothetical protein
MIAEGILYTAYTHFPKWCSRTGKKRKGGSDNDPSCGDELTIQGVALECRKRRKVTM